MDRCPCNAVAAPRPNNYFCTETCHVDGNGNKIDHPMPHIARSTNKTEIARWHTNQTPTWNPEYHGW